MQDLASVKRDCLVSILTLYKRANAGHIGSSLSCLEILIYIFFRLYKKQDKFVLSKGHAALALYVVLEKVGLISLQELLSFYEDGTYLAAHPPCNMKLNGITFGTGSLGHGLSLSTGLAFSNRLTNKDFTVYCIISEGDCNEGSTWEAAMFAGQHKLDNLIVIIDHNGLQGFGRSEDILNLEPLKMKWEAFNFEVSIVNNGNDFDNLSIIIDEVSQNRGKPKCIIANTKKGNGISFMQDKMEWHYLPMDNNQFELALKEILD